MPNPTAPVAPRIDSTIGPAALPSVPLLRTPYRVALPVADAMTARTFSLSVVSFDVIV